MKKFYLFGLMIVCLCTVFCCEAKTTKKKENTKSRFKTEKKEKASNKTKKQIKGFVMLTDFKLAQEIARETKRPILLIFSGSDWCGWCVRLDKEVFSTAAFKNWAEKNLVCVLLDFPRRKPQSAELKKQNRALQAKYGVRGFPTVYLVKADGSVIGRTGYVKGGPQKYILNLKAMMAAKK